MPSPKDTFITVYGRMPVLEVLQDAGLTVDKVVIAEGSRGESLDRIRALARRRGVDLRTASAHRVKVLAGNGKHDQGVLADVVAPGWRSSRTSSSSPPPQVRTRCWCSMPSATPRTSG